MSFGFFGIQFGWALQMANMSAIYEYLGASAEQIPLLWLAAPVSGLIAQPIVGYLSDRTWCCLGRRRPYFLIGAILSSAALILMPHCSTLWMAAGLLWILDTSINISMEPFRAFTADLLPAEQRTQGFAMQSLLIGCGAVVAALLPWYLNHFFAAGDRGTNGSGIPFTIEISFYLGAAVFLAAVVWTVVTTPERPPEERFARSQSEPQTFGSAVREMVALILQMPERMKQLAGVQFFTWMGVFCVLLYFPAAIARYTFGTMDKSSPLYADGIAWAGVCIALYSGVCCLFSLLLPRLASVLGSKMTHSLCLLCGSVGIISLLWVRDRYFILLPMACFGIAWASILAMPYAMLSQSIPAKHTGIYMGIFNAFIVIPQILTALGLGWVMSHYLHHNCLLAVVLGGFCLLVAAVLVLSVEDLPWESRDGIPLLQNQLSANS